MKMGILDQKTFKHDRKVQLKFGKYGNDTWEQVPEEYLDFIIANFSYDSNAAQHARAEVQSRGIDPYKHLDED